MWLDNSFLENLTADPVVENYTRRVTDGYYSFVTPQQPANPSWISFNQDLAHAIGWDAHINQNEALDILSGAKPLSSGPSFAMNYGGHQFGHWAGQLGDGRAINIGEVYFNEARWMLQLKGAGPTPYARSGDGKAVLRSSIREYLMSEAMHHLRIPTTRALSLIATGEDVMRDIMYDGRAALEKGAIVCRVSPSFLRFGSYEIWASRQMDSYLQNLVDYTIRYFYPHLTHLHNRYVQFFKEVTDRTLHLMLEWERVGFVHGVMNTDNMSILGLTIDYGPYGWIDDYDPEWTPNTTDKVHRRYRYANQPAIGQWNLLQLANSLLPLIKDPIALKEIIENYKTDYEIQRLHLYKKKLGWAQDHQDDAQYVDLLHVLMKDNQVDMTMLYRELATIAKAKIMSGVQIDLSKFLLKISYQTSSPSKTSLDNWQKFIDYHIRRIQLFTPLDIEKLKHIAQYNPKYVLRNYMAQLAIDAADKGDYSVLSTLSAMLKKPYEDQPEYDEYYTKRPDWAKNKIGCSQLSCSS